jgi:cytochrome c peroxidase
MKLIRVLTMLAFASTVGAIADANEQAGDPWLRPAQVPAPATNIPSFERIELGRALFFDPRLSGSNWISCATCHNPALGWSDGLATAIGHGFKTLRRKTPTVLNTAYNPLQMWDGRKPTLEDQALGPISSADEMNLPLEALVAKIKAIDGYAPLFAKAYPGEAISAETIAKAIASFERTVVSTESPFDRWRAGDEQAVSASVKRGFDVFQNKGRCTMCHQGFNFTDNGFHNIGIKSSGGEDDVGRFAHRKVKVNKGAFKTPTLRDVELTAPYMHNGIYKTLADVVDHYDRGGDIKDNLDPNMQPLSLSAQEKSDLVNFLKSLTGTRMLVSLPALPPN